MTFLCKLKENKLNNFELLHMLISKLYQSQRTETWEEMDMLCCSGANYLDFGVSQMVAKMFCV